jgi:hypothetical protein
MRSEPGILKVLPTPVSIDEHFEMTFTEGLPQKRNTKKK